jgi:hypothetical protein
MHDPRLPALKRTLRTHPLCTVVDDARALRRFTEAHVYAVLDFMSLLKSLQAELTCVRVPWTPAPDPEAGRLIQEIVLGEEHDEIEPGRHASHFEWYLEAMDELGADTSVVRELVARLARGEDPRAAIDACDLPPWSAAFTRTTYALLERPLHERASAFFHGREDVIPDLFLPIVRRLHASGLPCAKLIGYLERHIDVDGGTHGPRAAQLIERLTAGDATRAHEAERAAVTALEARVALWDALHAELADRTLAAGA